MDGKLIRGYNHQEVILVSRGWDLPWWEQGSLDLLLLFPRSGTRGLVVVGPRWTRCERQFAPLRVEAIGSSTDPADSAAEMIALFCRYAVPSTI